MSPNGLDNSARVFFVLFFMFGTIQKCLLSLHDRQVFIANESPAGDLGFESQAV